MEIASRFRIFVLFFCVFVIVYEILLFFFHDESCGDRKRRIPAMRDFMKRYFSCDEGSTAIEYSLIATGISIAIVVVVYLIGEHVTGLYEGLIGLFTS